jgi:toxin ParE1/3/4
VSATTADRRFRIHDDATLELRRAAAWYEERREGLGVDLVMAVNSAVAKIVEAPERWPRFGGASRYVLKRFPYSVIFRVGAGEVVLIAIAHHSRRPTYWKRRR